MSKEIKDAAQQQAEQAYNGEQYDPQGMSK